MIEKQKLLDILKKAQEVEEKAIPIYMKHLNSAIFWTGMSSDKQKKAKEFIEVLAGDSVGHKETVEKLIKKITEKNKNAF